MKDWQTLCAVDFDKDACATYRANFPDVECLQASVADVIPQLPKADVIIAGPPCQPFSVAGKRDGSEDARDCVPDFCAAVEHTHPRMFLMENVPGLLTIHDGAYIGATIHRMERAGYKVDAKVLDAVDYGVPQFRARLFLWGIRNDVYASGVRWQWPARTHVDPKAIGSMFEELPPWVTVGEALGITGKVIRCVDHREGRRKGDVTDSPSVTLTKDAASDVQNRIVEYRWSDAMYEKHPPASPVLSLDGTVEAQPCDTLTAGHRDGEGGCDPVAHMKRQRYVRRLTPLECGRLQSIPDDFKWPAKITKTAQYRIVGNGMACQIMWHLSEAFRKADPQSKTVIDLFCGGGLGACGWRGKYWHLTRP